MTRELDTPQHQEKKPSHGVRLDGSAVCGEKPGPWQTDCITPTCAKCQAHYARIKSALRRANEASRG